jgi:protein TonB
MLNDKVTRVAFFVSLSGHLLFLGMPGLNLRTPDEIKEPEQITVRLEIEIPSLLPAIEEIGEEKKLKEIESEPLPEHKDTRSPEPFVESEPLPEHRDARALEPFKEVIKVIDPQDEAMLRYQDMVKQKIESHLRYPDWAKRQGFEGITYLSFIILSDGQVRDIKIIQSSGFDILDNEAVSTVERAAPFEPIPEKFNRSTLTMEAAIVFMLEPA